MFPFSTCVCQQYNKWCIISNNLINFTDDNFLVNSTDASNNDSADSSDNNNNNMNSPMKIMCHITNATKANMGSRESYGINGHHSSCCCFTLSDYTQPCASFNADSQELGIETQLSLGFINRSFQNSPNNNNAPSEPKHTAEVQEQKCLLNENDKQLLSNAGNNDVKRLLKIQKQKKFVKRRSSFDFLRKIRITTPDNMGLVDTCNLKLADEYIEKFINSWKFNIFRLNRFSGGHSSLIPVTTKIFQYHNLLSHFQIRHDQLSQFLYQVQDVYHAFNPYHNALHASDVIQAMHCFLIQDKLTQISTPLEVLGCLISALCHDADHPGKNQFYLEKIQHFFVSLYNHSSVLENHHTRVTLCLLQQSTLLNSQSVTRDDWLQLTSFITKLILATDIAHQKAYLSKFSNLVREKKSTQEFTTEDKTLIFQMSMKCSDISNPCRSWPITLGWATLVCEEFFLQGDIEKKEGLAVMPTYDRCMTTKADIQLNFIRFVVRPLISQWLSWLQHSQQHATKSIEPNKITIKSHLQLDTQLENNLSYWEQYKQYHSLLLATKIIESSDIKIQEKDESSENPSITTNNQQQTVSISTVGIEKSQTLATLTEESTLSSQLCSNNDGRRMSTNNNSVNLTTDYLNIIGSSSSRRLSLPDDKRSNNHMTNQPRLSVVTTNTNLLQSPSTTIMTVMSKSNLSSDSSGPYPPPPPPILLLPNSNVQHPRHMHTLSVYQDNSLEKRRCSLPQYVKPVSSTNQGTKTLVQTSITTVPRRRSLPLNVISKPIPIPISWQEDKNSDGYQGNLSSIVTHENNEVDISHDYYQTNNRIGNITKYPRANIYNSRNERRGSAPTISNASTNHHHHRNHHQQNHINHQNRDTGLISTCSRERLLLEVYWMNRHGSLGLPASSVVSSCASSLYQLYDCNDESSPSSYS